MAKNKMLVVYNTCGFGHNEKVDWYIDCLNNILNQDFDEFQVVVSSCGNSVPVIKQLLKQFGTRIAYNFINESTSGTTKMSLLKLMIYISLVHMEWSQYRLAMILGLKSG